MRYVKRMVRHNPRISWKALIANTPQSVSKSTLRRVLRKFYLKKWRSKKRILLTKDDAQKRLEFAREWEDFDA